MLLPPQSYCWKFWARPSNHGHLARSSRFRPVRFHTSSSSYQHRECLTVKNHKKVFSVAGLLAGGLLACLPASASVVTDWNALAVGCANRPGGPASILDIALAQAA